MADNQTRHQDRLSVRVAIFILLCCISGFVLYFSVRWWTTWWFEVSKNPTAAYLREEHKRLEASHLQFYAVLEDGTSHPPAGFLTLREILAMSDDRRSSLTISVNIYGEGRRVIKRGRTASHRNETENTNGMSDPGVGPQ